MSEHGSFRGEEELGDGRDIEMSLAKVNNEELHIRTMSQFKSSMAQK